MGIQYEGLTRWCLAVVRMGCMYVQSGQVGFPLLLNKALKWAQEA